MTRPESPPASSAGSLSEHALSREARTIKRSMMRDLIAVTSQPGIISFAGGLPAPELYPIDAWRAATDRVLTTDGRRALSYGPPYPPLLEAVAELMQSRGIDADPSRILITTGAQQGLHIVARLLLDPDSTCLVDRYVFTGVRQAFGGPDRRLLDLDVTPEDGVQLSSLEQRVAESPRASALVVIPDFHNPMGTQLDDRKRDAILDLARAGAVPVVEDDPYGFLAFEGKLGRPLAARDPESVIYLGSFSKIVAPAVRVGWVIAPPNLIEKLRVIKESVDLETSALTQRILAAFLAEGHLSDHLDRVRHAYRARASVMLEALEKHFPPGARWSSPRGGMFLWAELPDGYDTLQLLEKAVAAGVAYVPGGAFAADPRSSTMRLNFSNAAAEEIRSGIARLGQVLRSHQ